MKKVSSEDIKKLQQGGLIFKKITPEYFDNLTASQIHKLYEGRTLVERIELMYDLIKIQGNPFKMLGNNLDTLRIYDIEEDLLENIAVQLILTKVFINKNETSKWKKEKEVYTDFLETPYAQARPDIYKDVQLELLNITNRFSFDFIADTIGTLKYILPIESDTDKNVLISGLFNELGIKKEKPYYTEEKADELYKYGEISQPGRKAITKRIKKDSANYEQMFEYTLQLINENPKLL